MSSFSWHSFPLVLYCTLNKTSVTTKSRRMSFLLLVLRIPIFFGFFCLIEWHFKNVMMASAGAKISLLFVDSRLTDQQIPDIKSFVLVWYSIWQTLSWCEFTSPTESNEVQRTESICFKSFYLQNDIANKDNYGITGNFDMK